MECQLERLVERDRARDQPRGELERVLVGETGLVTQQALGRRPLVRAQLPPDASAPGLARRALEQARDAMDEDALSAARLLVSELVTNCVRHAALGPGEHIRLEVTVATRGMRVEVADPGPGFEAPGPAALEDVRGRGLLLVDAVAERWGVVHDGLTRVWFELDRR